MFLIESFVLLSSSTKNAEDRDNRQMKTCSNLYRSQDRKQILCVVKQKDLIRNQKNTIMASFNGSTPITASSGQISAKSFCPKFGQQREEGIREKEKEKEKDKEKLKLNGKERRREKEVHQSGKYRFTDSGIGNSWLIANKLLVMIL